LLYAEVSVNAPAAGRSAFSYQIPAGMNVRPGQTVLVPFGQKILQGIVIERAEQPRFAETRPLDGLIQPPICLTPQQLAAGLFISRHYLAPLFASLALWLPPGFERQAAAEIYRTSQPADVALTPLESAIMAVLPDTCIGQKALEQQFGAAKTGPALRHLLEQGLIDRSYHLAPTRIKPRLERVIILNISADAAADTAAGLTIRARRQADILFRLANSRGRLPLSDLRRELGDVTASVNTLKNKGLLSVIEEEAPRVPRLPAAVELPLTPALTAAQQSALTAVNQGLDTAIPGRAPVFLLHGVTGSGKTEVYLHAAAHALQQGRQVIILVPEIALTHQIVERFTARFPGRVAVLHSRLSLGERFDQWRAIAEGGLDIIIGPRSALFAPAARLGLIVMDEEHEWAYKQQDTPPLYHARTVARRLAQEYGAALLLGSATPDVESYHLAVTGRYRLLELPDRLTPHVNTPLPPVTLVDLRQELKSGNLSIFSRRLKTEMTAALRNGEQIILFYNRRGGATFIQCRDCGEVIKCRNCQLPLGYHPVENRLVCHHCNAGYRLPETCPVCRSRRIKYLGLGTQKLEEETRREFPESRILRWDSDAARGKDAGYRIFDEFRSGKADILIGTQVVARGLDLPGVGLVGVINADTALNLPDFRAGERTFQLLAQVAGRAGRGEFAGRVVVQSYQPEHYAVAAAVGHNYAEFYQKELDYRRMLGYPPFGELAVITTRHVREAESLRQAQNIKQKLTGQLDARGLTGISFIGPAPAFVPRRRGCYRFQLIVKGAEVTDFLNRAGLPAGLSIDVDPLGLS
jgi:primosomal protein N' (replication factor Y)